VYVLSVCIFNVSTKLVSTQCFKTKEGVDLICKVLLVMKFINKIGGVLQMKFSDFMNPDEVKTL